MQRATTMLTATAALKRISSGASLAVAEMKKAAAAEKAKSVKEANAINS